MNQLQERSRKRLIISLSKIQLSDDFIVVYPVNKISLDLLKLFLRVNRMMIALVNSLSWGRNNGELEKYKEIQQQIRNKLDELFELIKNLEKERRSK